ncbi:MAG: type II secretion system F family protein [Phycisphaerales bacterium]|nr:type II secretion system F family protein [Phycisphaerales bacterium]
MSSDILLLIMPLAGAMLLSLGVFQVVMDLRTTKKRRVIDRLNESAARPGQNESRDSLLRKRAAEIRGNALEGLVDNLHVVTKLQKLLDQADINWYASRLLINMAGVGLLLGASILFLGFGPLSAVLAAGGVATLPLMVILFIRKRRIKKLIGQLPDVFELMGQGLRAGHSLASAIQLVSQQMPDPIGGEFARVFHEQNLGIKIEEALLNMAQRIDQMDVRFFVTAVLIQRQTGGDLAEVLDKIGSVIRDRIQLFGAVQALTAEGRLSGWVLLGLPVLVFFVALYVSPEYAETLLNTRQGRIMLGTAAAMDLMGLAMIRKIVNIKV